MPSLPMRTPTCFYRAMHEGELDSISPFRTKSGELPLIFKSRPSSDLDYQNKIDLPPATGMYRLALGNVLYLDEQTTYRGLLDIISSDSGNCDLARRLVLAVEWQLDGQYHPGMIASLESNSGATCVTEDLCNQPEFIQLLRQSAYNTIAWKADGGSNTHYMVMDTDQVSPYFATSRADVPPDLRMLVNKFTSLVSSSDDALRPGMEGLLSKRLAKFLSEHCVEANIIMTQGEKTRGGPSGNNQLVHTAVSYGDVVIDANIIDEGEFFFVYLNRHTYLMDWQWVVSERQEPKSHSSDFAARPETIF